MAWRTQVQKQTSPQQSEQLVEWNTQHSTNLDEIDQVLEVNAEEFVKGFVQKGGQ